MANKEILIEVEKKFKHKINSRKTHNGELFVECENCGLWGYLVSSCGGKCQSTPVGEIFNKSCKKGDSA